MENIKDIHIDAKNLKIDISAERLNNNLAKAMEQLGEEILADCTALVPKREGVLRNSGYVRIQNQSTQGEVIWDTPYAHYQYEGIVYVSAETGSTYAAIGEKKIPAEPERKLTYGEPEAADHWCEKAKDKYGDKWIRNFKETAGK